MDPDQTFQRWIADMESIRRDVHELFRLRRTFRDVAEVFRNNPQLQEHGGHVWDWMRLNHVASVLMRLRRLIDRQRNTVSLKQLLHEIIEQPHVISRGRRNNRYSVESEMLSDVLDREFTDRWVRERNCDPADDHVDPAIVSADLDQLEGALESVVQFANRAVAHRQRVPPPGTLTIEEVDRAFDAVEAVFVRYYALICGASLVQAEPAPQFDTHEVFTFPWIKPKEE
jgi:hypothetical protein